VIEVVSAERCVLCDVCIKVCPTDVFDRGPDGLPVIARQSDCQTCFMCEANCPTDALYVAPLTGPAPEGSSHTDVAALADADAFGLYRRYVGWGGGRTPGARLDTNHIFTTRVRTVTETPPAEEGGEHDRP
jgi:NAD-dependent dihydropyrimidine dehydrogenase PreA subunit